MTALLINLLIEKRQKFEHFKITFGDIADLFSECHIKIRGSFSQECLKFVASNYSGALCTYQHLTNNDWVTATSRMLLEVQSRSVFLYFEDHRLVDSKCILKEIMNSFNENRIDYLIYSFYRASSLGPQNLLPLSPVRHILFDQFCLTPANINLLGKICPAYYVFALPCVASAKYFSSILSLESKKIKIYNSFFNKVLFRLFPYPAYRVIFKKINDIISIFNSRLCMYPPNTPFNLEKMWFELSFSSNDEWQFGIAKQELFANYDDDNGAHGESLIKRGLYPFLSEAPIIPNLNLETAIKTKLNLRRFDKFDMLYYSAVRRVSNPPIVDVKVISGRIRLSVLDSIHLLGPGDQRSLYSNIGGQLEALEESLLELQIFDEVF
jgi:hypothetical protein